MVIRWELTVRISHGKCVFLKNDSIDLTIDFPGLALSNLGSGEGDVATGNW